jgi:adenosylcobinamide-phosphate synthase
VCLDLVLGDPRWLPHPVRAIGRAAEWLEPRIATRLGRTRIAGAVFAAAIVAATYLMAWVSLEAAAALHPAAEWCAATYLVYTAVAARDLDREAHGVARALAAGDLSLARAAVARIVGRDTHALDAPEIARAAVESVAESTVDGCVSPLCYAIVGGPAAALAFKAISTLDSMVGYRNERYRAFGAFAARADDVAGYVPARLARFVAPVAAACVRLRSRACWRIAWRDGAHSPSPNAGIPEAAFAGALGVRLGGPSSYGGVVTAKPYLGDALRALEPLDIARSIRLMYATTGLTLVALGAARVAIG